MPTVDAPPRVTQAAADHHLGPLVAATKGSNPFTNAIFALVLSALLFGAVVLVGSLGLAALRKVLLVLLALSMVGVLFALVSLFTGFRRFFLFTNGTVHWQNGRVIVANWSDVTNIKRTRLGNVRTGYAMTLTNGKKLQVEAIENAEAGKLFGHQLEQVATQSGLPISG